MCLKLAHVGLNSSFTRHALPLLCLGYLITHPEISPRNLSHHLFLTSYIPVTQKPETLYPNDCNDLKLMTTDNFTVVRAQAAVRQNRVCILALTIPNYRT